MLKPSWEMTKLRVRNHVFRAWTALAVLSAFIYGWVYRPETLTWWERTTTALVDRACGLLPWPWGDRIESTLGNFGLWVQITLAIIAFRILVWLVLLTARLLMGRRTRDRARTE